MGAASAANLRGRRVPTWGTAGGSLAGLLVAAVRGWQALALNLLGLVVGGSLLLPFTWAGCFGAGDALLLAAIGPWQGCQFVLWTAWWAAPVGVGPALLARRRGQRIIPYVPAVGVGAALARHFVSGHRVTLKVSIRGKTGQFVLEFVLAMIVD